MQALTSIDLGQWQAEMHAISEYFDSFGDRLPAALREELARIEAELDGVAVKAS